MKKLLLIVIPLLLSGCSVPKDCTQCEFSKNNSCCSNECILKTQVTITKHNYQKFFILQFEKDDSEGEFSNIRLAIYPSLLFAFYKDSAISYKLNNAIEHNLEEFSISLDYGGHGVTPSYKFNYSGLLENFIGIEITAVSGICIF